MAEDRIADLIGGIVKESQSQETIETPDETPEVGVEGEEVVLENGEDDPQPLINEESQEEPDAEEETAEDDPNLDQDELISLDDEDEPDVDDTPQLDISELSERLGFSDISSEADLIQQVNSLRERAESNYNFANEEIELVNQLAQDGKDFKRYLNSDNEIQKTNQKIDNAQKALKLINETWDDKRVVEEQLFYEYGEGADPEAVKEEVENMSESQIKLRANKARNMFTQNINSQILKHEDSIEDIKNFKENIKTLENENVKKFINDLHSVIDKTDKFEGFKVDPGKKQQLKQIFSKETVDVRLPKGFADLLFDPKDGGMNLSSLVETAILKKYGGKMIAHHKNTSANKARTQEFKDLNNVSDSSSGRVRDMTEYTTDTNSVVDSVIAAARGER